MMMCFVCEEKGGLVFNVLESLRPKCWETNVCRSPGSAVTCSVIIELALQYITGVLMAVEVTAMCRGKWIVAIAIDQYTCQFQLPLTGESQKPVLALQIGRGCTRKSPALDALHLDTFLLVSHSAHK